MMGFMLCAKLKRCVRRTCVFLCASMACVSVFLSQRFGTATKESPFYLTNNITKDSSVSFRALERYAPTQATVKANIASHNNKSDLEDSNVMDEEIRLESKPDRFQNQRDELKRNADSMPGDGSKLKAHTNAGVVKKSVRQSEKRPEYHVTKDLGKLPRKNDKAAEKRYYFLGNKRVNPINQEFLIKGEHICAATAPFLLIVIPSIPSHFSVRKIIRKTYGSYAKFRGNVAANSHTSIKETMKVMFLVGRGENKALDEQISDESAKYKDIVQADFKESYYNLTLKMLLALKWTTAYCSKLEYMLKIDEDTFVNIPTLIKTIKNQPYGTKGTIYGYVLRQAPVQRSGKWEVNLEEFPLALYPSYVSGNSYVISGNILQRMFTLSEYYPYMPIEDVFVTGILARVIGAEHVTDPRFTVWAGERPEPCVFVKTNKISATKVTVILMKKLWDALTDFDNFCKNE